MWLSVLTQTNPCPPPGAGVALVSAELVVVVAAGLGDVFGLNIDPIFENGLAGDADGVGVAVGAAAAFLRAGCSAGDADAAGLALGAGDASAFLRPPFFAGEGEASGLVAGAGEVSAFLCPRVLAGDADASGLTAGAGEVSAFLRPRVLAGEAEASGLVAGAGEASAFFLRTFFAGEADASGLAPGDGARLCASTSEAHAKIIIDKSRARFVVIKRRLGACADFRQR
jgi:hypothetical protein